MHANWIYAGLKSFPPDTFIFMAKGLIYLGILLQANFYTNMATIFIINAAAFTSPSNIFTLLYFFINRQSYHCISKTLSPFFSVIVTAKLYVTSL